MASPRGRRHLPVWLVTAVLLLARCGSAQERSVCDRLAAADQDSRPDVHIAVLFADDMVLAEVQDELARANTDSAEFASRMLESICKLSMVENDCKPISYNLQSWPIFSGQLKPTLEHACLIKRTVDWDDRFTKTLQDKLFTLGLPFTSIVSVNVHIEDSTDKAQILSSYVRIPSSSSECRSELQLYKTILWCVLSVFGLLVGIITLLVSAKVIQVKLASHLENRSPVHRIPLQPKMHRTNTGTSHVSGGFILSCRSPTPECLTDDAGMPMGADAPAVAVQFGGEMEDLGYNAPRLRAISSGNSCSSAGAQDGPRTAKASNAAITQLKVGFDSLYFEKEIGSGRCKTVYSGKWGSTAVAIVKMNQGVMVAEAQIMQKLVNHPNLVQFYRWSRDTHGTEYMIMELIGNGSLDQLLRSGSPLTVAQKLKISEQICDAMCELCNKELLHGDLAARNVLVSSTSPIHVKVADFGLSREWDGLDNHTTNKKMFDAIPLRWTPPEVFRKASWSEKSDVWAFGVTLWEIFSGGEEPYVRDLVDTSRDNIIEYVVAGNHLSKPLSCPDQIYCLMTVGAKPPPASFTPVFDTPPSAALNPQTPATSVYKDCWRYKAEDRPTFQHLKVRFRGIHTNFHGRPSLLKANESSPRHESLGHGDVKPDAEDHHALAHLPHGLMTANPHGLIIPHEFLEGCSKPVVPESVRADSAGPEDVTDPLLVGTGGYACMKELVGIAKSAKQLDDHKVHSDKSSQHPRPEVMVSWKAAKSHDGLGNDRSDAPTCSGSPGSYQNLRMVMARPTQAKVCPPDLPGSPLLEGASGRRAGP